MGKTKIAVLTVTLFIFLAGCNPQERYSRTVEMPLAIINNQELAISLDVGSIGISGKDIENGSITAKITGKGDTIEKAKTVAESISIEVETNKNTVFIKINKPIKVKDNWYSVDYTIESPEYISVKARTDVGSITISNIKGDIVAESDVGSINCKNIFGKTHLKTDVGNITLAYNEEAAGPIDSELSVDVGSITFRGPKNLSAKIDVQTDVGSINTILPITLTGNLSSKKINGVIGNGEGKISLKTDVGSITIK